MQFNPHILHSEIKLKAVRSSGKGGQHVNKVSTRVELYFNVQHSAFFNEEQKQLILQKLKNRINGEGELILSSQTERSQLANKKEVILRFDELIKKALEKKKRRIPTKISKVKQQQRLESKMLHAQKKLFRKKDWDS